jgi:hypothetical protein
MGGGLIGAGFLKVTGGGPGGVGQGVGNSIGVKEMVSVNGAEAMVWLMRGGRRGEYVEREVAGGGS